MLSGSFTIFWWKKCKILGNLNSETLKFARFSLHNEGKEESYWWEKDGGVESEGITCRYRFLPMFSSLENLEQVHH